MMWWNGSWAWAWMVTMPLLIGLCVALVWIVVAGVPHQRTGSERALERLDRRLASGEISIEDYRARRVLIER